ncbi:cell division protein ZapD [Acidithiobacillus sp.]
MSLYEYPLNERTRLFLRLEGVFARLRSPLGSDAPGTLRAALRACNEILDFCSRPELRLDLILELERLAHTFALWAQSPEVDADQLRSLQFRVDQRLQVLREKRAPFGESLRHQELINLARGRLGVPGGLADCDLPILAFWCQRAPEEIAALLASWVESLEGLEEGVSLVLDLVRESCSWSLAEATDGRYGAPLNPRQPPALVCIRLRDGLDYFPKFSGGAHRFHIHFLQWLDQGTTRLLESPVEFHLGLSAL